MAGHPLRPATRQSLGRPLPHQQADRPRAHPWPKKLSTNTPCRDRSYPVLATVSGSYPKAKGRLLTCYSPVRRSSTPKRAFPLDLHVLSTPPAFVLSQDQTLQTKTKNACSEQSDQSNQYQTGKKTNHTQGTGRQEHGQNKNNKQKPPNTLLSSQTTSPARPRDKPAAFGRVLVVRTIRNPPKWGFPLGAAALFRARPVSQRLR